jgi:hypothetical protein
VEAAITTVFFAIAFDLVFNEGRALAGIISAIRGKR